MDLASEWTDRIKQTILLLSDQLSEEGNESKIPVQQSSEVSNGLRVVSTRKSVVSTKEDKGKN